MFVIASHKNKTQQKQQESAALSHTKISFPLLCSHHKMTDLSNDSYSTVNIGLDEGASPHSGRGSFLHGNSATPPYLSSHSNPMGQGNHFPYSDNIVYTPLGESQTFIETNVCRETHEGCRWAGMTVNTIFHL